MNTLPIPPEWREGHVLICYYGHSWMPVYFTLMTLIRGLHRTSKASHKLEASPHMLQSSYKLTLELSSTPSCIVMHLTTCIEARLTKKYTACLKAKGGSSLHAFVFLHVVPSLAFRGSLNGFQGQQLEKTGAGGSGLLRPTAGLERVGYARPIGLAVCCV